MIPIEPLEEAQVKQFVGRPVFAVTQAGENRLGLLTGVGSGRLFFNGHPEGEESPKAGARSVKGRRKQRRRTRGKTKRSAHILREQGEWPNAVAHEGEAAEPPFFGPFGPPFALRLGEVGSLWWVVD